MQKSGIAKTRGIKGAASWCALAAFVYLFAKNLFTLLISFLMNLRVEGSSLAEPIGFSPAAAEMLSMLVGISAIFVPLFWLLHSTRLEPEDLRIALPAPWSPALCLPLFLGIANVGNLFGSLLARLTGATSAGAVLPAGGVALFVEFVGLCVVPAVTEELFFRGALQGLVRPSGSAVAIFAPALLFSLLHLDLAQSITAFLCGLFLGWLAERTGSILPGMLLHFVNNSLAFLSLYLRSYAPANVAVVYDLTLLIGFPLLALWLLWRAEKQGFRFSAGMRPGVEPTAAFSSPAYTVSVVFLVFLTVYTKLLG